MKKICRLCLNVFEACSNEFQSLGAPIMEIFNAVLLNLNFNATEDPIVCNVCEEKLYESYNFKMMWLSTEDCMFRYNNSSDRKRRPDLKMVRLAEKMNVQNGEFKDHHEVCRICLNLTNIHTSLKLDISAHIECLEKSMPELDLFAIDGDTICENCHVSLENYAHFIKYCRHTERKIENYQKTTGINYGTDIDLQRVLEYSFASCDTLIKLETKEVEKVLIKNGIFEIEHVSVKADIIDGQAACINEGLETHTDESIENNIIPIKEENYSDSLQNYELNSPERCIKTEIVDIKSDCGDESTNPVIIGELEQSNRKYNCNGQLEMLKCTECQTSEFQTNNQFNSEMFKCALCSYKTKRKGNLKSHILIHKPLSSAAVFKCENCSYEAKRKGNLKNHILTHEPLSNVEIFKCEICSYETKRKGDLQRHVLIHKHLFNVPVYKCDFCSYETKRKGDLQCHIVIHKPLSNVEILKCEFCSYETTRKRNLQQHILIHVPPSKVEIFKCELCCFETRHKGSLVRHVPVHKPLSKVEIFKCEFCSFETNHKRYLQQHIRIHQSSSDVEIFKCEFCSYETKRQRNIQRHILIHKPLSSVQVFKCEMCSFNTKHKRSLVQHILNHNPISKI